LWPRGGITTVGVNIFYPELRRLIGSQNEVQVDGATVGECLQELVQRYPGADKLLFDQRGRLLKPVYVFVNAESMFKADLTQAVGDKDELILAVLATGG
jgi:molybdopterin converting factor small subunit